MTQSEVTALLVRARKIYPSFNTTGAEFDEMAKVWSTELADFEAPLVFAAFRVAMATSPTWMPSLSAVLISISALKLAPRSKDASREFKDLHGGMTKEEYEKTIAWNNSPEGIKKKEEYKKRIKHIFLNAREG